MLTVNVSESESYDQKGYTDYAPAFLEAMQSTATDAERMIHILVQQRQPSFVIFAVHQFELTAEIAVS